METAFKKESGFSAVFRLTFQLVAPIMSPVCGFA